MRQTLLFLALSLSAGIGQAANLSEIHQLAQENDPVYAAAQAAWRAGQELLPQAQALMRPAVTASGYLRGSASDTGSTSKNYGSVGYALSLVQPVYRKQNLETYEQAKLGVTQAERQLQLAQQDLALRTAKAYFDTLLAQDTLTTLEAQKQALEEQLAQAKKSFEVGVSTIVDTHEAQARYDLATSQEIAARNDLEVKRRSLEKMIGREAPALSPLVADIKIPSPQPDAMEAWVQQAEEFNLVVQYRQAALESARREIERQRGSFLPTVDLNARYSDDRNAGYGAYDARSGVLGLELGWTLYQSGSRTSKVREAVANQEKARSELDNARRQSALDARQAYLGVKSGNAQIKALDQALISSQSQLSSTKLGLDVGVRTRVDVLNAQQTVFSTQKDLAAARYQTLIAGLQLKAAVGALNGDEIKALDAVLK